MDGDGAVMAMEECARLLFPVGHQLILWNQDEPGAASGEMGQQFVCHFRGEVPGGVHIPRIRGGLVEAIPFGGVDSARQHPEPSLVFGYFPGDQCIEFLFPRGGFCLMLPPEGMEAPAYGKDVQLDEDGGGIEKSASAFQAGVAGQGIEDEAAGEEGDCIVGEAVFPMQQQEEIEKQADCNGQPGLSAFVAEWKGDQGAERREEK